MSSTSSLPVRAGVRQHPASSTLPDWLALLAVVVLSAIVFSKPFRAGGDLLRFAQDDFYYYLVVARNLAAGLPSTFDGSTLTNGYHPLYLLVLWGAATVCHSLRAIYGFLAGLDVLSATVIFLATRSLFRRVTSDAWLANGLALAMVFLCDFKLFHQMEVTLTLPLGFVFLAQLARGPARLNRMAWLLVGMTAAFTLLSRLDSVFLILLALAACLCERTYRQSLSAGRVGAFLTGFLPLPVLYVLVNERVFHRVMPISGAAKDLGPGLGWSRDAVLVSLSPEAMIMFAAALVALLLMPLWWPRVAASTRVLALTGLVFPFLHWGVLFTISNWKLWGWYNYSLRFAVLGILLVAAELWTHHEARLPAAVRPALVGYAAFAAGVAALLLIHYRVDYEMRDIALAADGLATFTHAHPGRYAMGDRAGMVGYTDGMPTIQTEGLMMDAAFLNHIRRQDSLKDVLHDYRINYYIVYQRDPQPTGCLEAREPFNAGPQAPVMRGEFCDPPLLVVPVVTGRTYVFAVK